MHGRSVNRSRISFSLADRSDDSLLCAFAAKHPSSGSIQLALDTSPSYLEAQAVGSEDHETLVAKNSKGEILGAGNFSIRKAYIDGKQAEYTYLSGLRILPEQRGSLLLSQGYRVLGSLNLKRPSPFTISTILEDNMVARQILESGRASLPEYNCLGSYSTLGISTFTWRPIQRTKSVQIRRLNECEVEDWTTFLKKNGTRRHFFPVIEPDVFKPGNTVWKNLKASDVWVAVNGDGIIGTVALWNQNDFRRWRVQRYGFSLRYLRPIYNLGSRVFCQGVLPPPGSCLDVDFVSLICIKNDDPGIFEYLLLDAARNRPRNRMLMAGFHESDPLLNIAMRRKSYELRSRVYLVNWNKGKQHATLKANLPIHLEVGTL